MTTSNQSIERKGADGTARKRVGPTMAAAQIKFLRERLTPTPQELRLRTTRGAFPKYGLTIKEAAMRIRVSPNTWNRWEMGWPIPPSKVLLLKYLRSQDQRGNERPTR